MLIDIYMKFREDSLNGFQVIERTRFYDRQTRGRKIICLPTLKKGDIIKFISDPAARLTASYCPCRRVNTLSSYWPSLSTASAWLSHTRKRLHYYISIEPQSVYIYNHHFFIGNTTSLLACVEPERRTLLTAGCSGKCEPLDAHIK